MQIIGFLGPAALVVAVAGEICQKCSSEGAGSVDLKILGAPDANSFVIASKPDEVFVAAGKGPKLATDEVWDSCKQKGCIIEWSMHHDSNQVGPHFVPPQINAESPFQTGEDLKTWYWHERPDNEMGNEDDSQLRDDWGLDDALDGLGLSSYTYLHEGGKNRILSMAHVDSHGWSTADQQTYQVNGQTYRATGADYTVSFNTEEGAIIGLSREGPARAAHRRYPEIPAAQMPRLHQFSDVGWLTWQEMTKKDGHDAKNLRYLFSVSIENETTLSVCHRVFVNNKYKNKPWPGLTLEAGTDDFHAILGTPNMQGYGYMLIQHKAKLGNMYISKIQVFKCTTTSMVCIVAHVSQPRSAPSSVPEQGVEELPSGIVRRDEDHNLVRTHKIFAKL